MYEPSKNAQAPQNVLQLIPHFWYFISGYAKNPKKPLHATQALMKLSGFDLAGRLPCTLHLPTTLILAFFQYAGIDRIVSRLLTPTHMLDFCRFAGIGHNSGKTAHTYIQHHLMREYEDQLLISQLQVQQQRGWAARWKNRWLSPSHAEWLTTEMRVRAEDDCPVA